MLLHINVLLFHDARVSIDGSGKNTWRVKRRQSWCPRVRAKNCDCAVWHEAAFHDASRNWRSADKIVFNRARTGAPAPVVCDFPYSGAPLPSSLCS